jgi:DNA polymerase-1
MTAHLYLIDGSGFIFRAFYALPPLNRADGTPVNAVLGFSNMLYKLLEETPDVEYLAVIFDSARRNFRHEIYPAYKAHRAEPPEELVPQFALIREACRAFCVPVVEKEGFEADDLIATYTHFAQKEGMAVTIVSSDKDLMQLVNQDVNMLDPLKDRFIGPAEVKAKFGVDPEKVADVQALAGDSIDGIPGVPGIGIKTAAELINTFGSLDSLLANCDKIPQPRRRQILQENQDNARLSWQLVSLKKDVPVDHVLENFKRKAVDINLLKNFLHAQSFRALSARIEKKYGSNQSLSFSQPIDHQQTTTSGAPSGVPSYEYELVQTIPALEKWIQKIQKAGLVAIDTETTSLDPWQAELVGISLAVQPYEACYIPLQHKRLQQHKLPQQQKPQQPFFATATGEPLMQLPLAEVVQRLRPLFFNPAILKIGHHLKYDMAVLQKYQLFLSPIADTMVMSYDLDGIKNSHSLDVLADLHLAHQTIQYKEISGTGHQALTFDYVDLEKARDYAAEDADVTLRLFELFRKRLAEEHLTSVYETIDRPLIPVLLAMESAGIKVDVVALQELSQELTHRLITLEKNIHQLAGRSFNVGSPKQLGEVLFEYMGIQGGKKGKSGAYTTSATVLDELALAGHPIAEKILEWRQLSKLKSTYTDALPAQINPRTGRIHTSYSLTITSTGRLSSSNPNLQNIPVRTEEGRKIRRAFLSQEGYRLVSLDYSQIELRLLAHMADIEALKIAFREGRDIHAATAAEVFGIPLDQVDSEHRRRAKAINFGIIYGISAFGLAQQLKIDRSIAAQYIQRYTEHYPGIIDYMETLKDEARRCGFVTTIFGRKCHILGIHDKNPAVRAAAERQAINAPLQGTAADVIKRAMITVTDAIKQYQLRSRLLLQVHDELVFEVPEEEIDKLIPLAKEAMENVVSLKVPLVTDVGIGTHWDEAHS